MSSNTNAISSSEPANETVAFAVKQRRQELRQTYPAYATVAREVERGIARNPLRELYALVDRLLVENENASLRERALREEEEDSEAATTDAENNDTATIPPWSKGQTMAYLVIQRRLNLKRTSAVTFTPPHRLFGGRQSFASATYKSARTAKLPSSAKHQLHKRQTSSTSTNMSDTPRTTSPAASEPQNATVAFVVEQRRAELRRTSPVYATVCREVENETATGIIADLHALITTLLVQSENRAFRHLAHDPAGDFDNLEPVAASLEETLDLRVHLAVGHGIRNGMTARETLERIAQTLRQYLEVVEEEELAEHELAGFVAVNRTLAVVVVAVLLPSLLLNAHLYFGSERVLGVIRTLLGVLMAAAVVRNLWS
ncbi:hypothetical protein BU16DRAFT_594306 [Lophium mytilinum]|uniref:Transmembrane protein n=1 Tax=Lophium mytilinum TaxID=390894 RepID=A0A6A6QG74_9PEZI|nr:hypothetical protein BU16DRAFT_594306 [Lophium mytilinum]